MCARRERLEHTHCLYYTLPRVGFGRRFRLHSRSIRPTACTQTPLIPPLVGVITGVLILGVLLQAFGQPQLAGYIIAGIIIGPAGFGIIPDVVLIGHPGGIGVTLLLFQIGMEISPRQLAAGWVLRVWQDAS